MRQSISIKYIISISITLLACIYLGWKLYYYTDYQLLWQTFHPNTTNQQWALCALIALLPLNLILESEKWRFLIRSVYPIKFKESFLNILFGQVGAFATPNRLGEYPSRCLAFPPYVRTKMITMGFIGSTVQTIIIILFGIIAFSLDLSKGSLKQLINTPYYTTLVIGLIIGGILALLALPYIGEKMEHSKYPLTRKIGQQFTTITHQQLSKIGLLSFLRYAVFSHQFYFALLTCGIFIPYHLAIIAILQMYLLITITPSISSAAVPIRSSFAILTLQNLTSLYPNILAASFLIWIINTVFPLAIGFFLFNKHQK